ncbi:MAG TPA: hypothetical protein VH188_00940 [Chthoniobacterales bacterium]|jgi:hypothetical protein|nr:hypothetical protein [Chthoniobacterales bacterium]
MLTRSLLAIVLLVCTKCLAADFDGDGVADEFKVVHEAEKVAKGAGVRLVNPWQGKKSSEKSSPKGLALMIRLTRQPQTFLLYDTDYFRTPMWKEGKPPVNVITKKDKGYAAWKKQVPALHADAIELGTEAGIDILLYWDGGWRLFWPKEEP